MLFDDVRTESELTSGSEVSMPWLPGDNEDSRYDLNNFGNFNFLCRETRYGVV